MTIRTVPAAILSATERRDLEAAVLAGRAAAERAAEHEVSRLGVSKDKSPAYLNEVERALRRELRAKARQLGDPVADGQLLPLLVAEIAYEQWHRLLFAKFLEANSLLIHPGFGMAVTLEECEELAAEMGDVDAWSVAARFASETLPGVFRLTDPCVKIGLAPEDLQRLERIIVGLNSDIFRREDALGWVYQFWQTKRKKQVNDAGNKVGGADISPVTQLFTENYMVRFLLENSLGAWWAGKHPESPLVGGWSYLKLSDGGVPTESYKRWPTAPAQLTLMDPCCGSGHFLVAAFGMLWRMRAEDEGLTPAAAQDAVLRDNLFGLELDPRCAQLATFNLVLEAWKQGGYREVPAPSVVCSGVPVRAAGSEWEDLAEGDDALRGTLSRLHSQFRNADTLGSLINPVSPNETGALLGQSGLLESADWDKVRDALSDAVSREGGTGSVLGDTVNDVANAARLLSRKYDLIITNPPFLARGSQSKILTDYADLHAPEARSDLATVFMTRLLAFGSEGTTIATVSPQNWLSLTSYTKFRAKLLTTTKWSWLVRLGSGAFVSISGQIVQPVLHIMTLQLPESDSCFHYVDAAAVTDKADATANNTFSTASQADQLKNPDSRVAPSSNTGQELLSRYADGVHGLGTKDAPRFIRKFWELPRLKPKWEPMQSTVSETLHWGGMENVVLWEGGKGTLHELAARGLAILAGGSAHGRSGVLVSQTGNLNCTLYHGQLFDKNAAVIALRDANLLPAVWAYCSSPEFASAVRELDRSLKVTNSTLVKVPFDLARWRGVAEAAGPLPEPYSNDPTQWIYNSSIKNSEDPLQVAVARLLGYSWPGQIEDGLATLADEDGIVCIPAVAGERNAADRLLEILAKAFGSDWSSATRDELLAAAGGKPGELEGWLRDKFFARHIGLFHNRPFIWQIWDGQKDGFSALLNYHTLTRGNLEKLTYTLLGAWISRQREDAAGGLVGADVRLRAAEALQQKLQLVLQGEAPYDIYVRWKELGDQPIGWDPDLDDGVRLNLRPFVTAGILRSKVNVKWDKDRGKNADGTDRINDLHSTLQEKQAARG